LKPIDLALEANGKEAGSLHVTGRWPIASNASEGTIRIIAKHLDCGPIADLTAMVPGRIPGPLPIDTDVTVALNPVSGDLTLLGREIIGPVHVARRDGGPGSATLRIEHDLIHRDNGIRVNSMSLAADRPDGLPDRVTATGSVPLLRKGHGQLTGTIASLDAAWHAALFSTSKSPPSPESRQRSGERPADLEKPWHAPALLLGLDTELSIGSISYGKLILGPGRLLSTGTGEQREVRLEPTGFVNGQIEGTLKIDGRQERPAFTWQSEGRGLNVAAILSAAEPGREPRLKGTGAFETSGSGVLAEGPLRNQLKGTATFTITDGQFVQSPTLRFLAKYTKIQELETMKFDSLQGRLQLDSGAIRIDQLAVRGSAASLDSTGTITPDNTLDGQIFAKIGPSLARRIKIPCMSALLATPDGFTTLPFALRVKGPLDQPDISVNPAAWEYTKDTMGSLADTMKNLIRGCREEPPEGRSQ
jgi:hypothetical protein